MKIATQSAMLHKDLAGSLYLLFDDDEMRYYLNFPSNFWFSEGKKNQVSSLEEYFKVNNIKISVEVGVKVNIYESEISVIPLVVVTQRFLIIMYGLLFDFYVFN